MAKRLILMLVGVAVVIGALAFVKMRQVRAAIAQQSSFQPPPEAVTTVVARQEDWPTTVGAIGSVEAVQGVTVSADLPGLVERISFESGKTVREGDVLVRLDSRQEQAQLAAGEAQRNLARLNLDRMGGLLREGITSQADYDRLNAEHAQAEARIGEIRATIARKTIRAPFSGVLGLRHVNLGQYLNGGDPIVSLQAIRPVYVNFSVPQQQVAPLRPGVAVRVTEEGASGVVSSGQITAIDSIVDESTRNVQVQATFANADAKLRPGMFVKAVVSVGTASAVVALPTSSISYAPYGDSVFIVASLKDPKGQAYRGVRQQIVKLGGSRGDQVAILSGVKAGEEVVTSGVFKLRPGAVVQVNNKVQPSNNRAPEPEDS
ncbi:MAG: efflux RND transporter periplasmic adaptor subunit [Thermoanaerobaculia bacterium]|nr:efflux RND transporter periplasmic adaptor subunit [Thermoanaerobaculia bacterium]